MNGIVIMVKILLGLLLIPAFLLAIYSGILISIYLDEFIEMIRVNIDFRRWFRNK